MRKLQSLCVSALINFAVSTQLMAMPAQPVPIPEDPSVAPQINISGTGISTLGYGKIAENRDSKARLNFSDSAVQLGAAQTLYRDSGVGSFGLGGVTTDETNRGTGKTLFLHQAFVDYQMESFEAVLGRTDTPTAHLVDFPILRGDDLITLTNPLNPFSNGDIAEENRYSNVASVTFNQHMTYFENVHVQHLIDSSGASADSAINSFGATFGFLGEPGMDALETLPSWGVGFEQMTRLPSADSGIHEAYAGGIINVGRSPTNRWELGLQNTVNWGSQLRSFSSVADSYRADANTAAASLRYLHSPFGAPANQIALTIAQKKYLKVSSASSWGFALTAVKRLGPGFDLVAQYQGQWRDAALAAAQAQGTAYVNVGEIGFTYNFDATFNRHISPHRSLLNQQHGYIRD